MDMLWKNVTGDQVVMLNLQQRTQALTPQVRATMASSGNMGKSKRWIIDSGATHHMTFDHTLLKSFKHSDGTKRVRVANGHQIGILGYGDIYLTKELILKGVLFVPTLDCNLVSVRKLMIDNNCVTMFTPSSSFFLSGEILEGEDLGGEDWIC